MSGPLGTLLDLLFPPRCVFCRRLLRRGEEGICSRCQQELPWALGAEAEQTGGILFPVRLPAVVSGPGPRLLPPL